MTAALYLIPISLGLGLLALIACVWTIRAGQYDNMETAASAATGSGSEEAKKT
jgi:cbb3-type cytochrome oxidase maturation protein